MGHVAESGFKAQMDLSTMVSYNINIYIYIYMHFMIP